MFKVTTMKGTLLKVLVALAIVASLFAAYFAVATPADSASAYTCGPVYVETVIVGYTYTFTYIDGRVIVHSTPIYGTITRCAGPGGFVIN